MAPLSFATIAPRKKISPKATHPTLGKALQYIYKNVPEGLWLVGGTALAGYYAEHRRSDDLDLFAIRPEVYRASVLAAKGLQNQGAQCLHEFSTPLYYRSNLMLNRYSFTLDIVLDENLGRVGHALQTSEGVWVADLPTLFMMKTATLISRCSEKDLFDLAWLEEQGGPLDIAQLLQAGIIMDGGFNIEALLISLKSGLLRKEACQFVLPASGINADQAFKKIVSFKKRLLRSLLDYEKTQPPSPEAKDLLQAVKHFKQTPNEIP